MLHPRIVGGVGVHGRTTVIAGFGAQFVMPGFVPVDLAQPVLGPVLGEPRRGIGVSDVDCVPRHVSRRVGGGNPTSSFLFRAVLRDRLIEELFLVFRGTPAAVDVQLDPVAGRVRRSLAKGTEESWVELGHGRILVVEDRHAVGDDTVSLTEHSRVLTAKTTLDAKTMVIATNGVGE